MKKIKIIEINATLESVALRSVLEEFGYKVEIAYIGRPNQFIKELNESTEFDYIIISGYGEKERFLMPILAENVYEKDEPKHITLDIIQTKIMISNKIILSTCCSTGNIELATPFLKKGNVFIGPKGDIEGSSSMFFIIQFFYEHLVMNKFVNDAYELSMNNDNETKLFTLFK